MRYAIPAAIPAVNIVVKQAIITTFVVMLTISFGVNHLIGNLVFFMMLPFKIVMHIYQMRYLYYRYPPHDYVYHLRRPG